VICLYLAFQGIQLDKVGAALSQVNLLWFIPSVICFGISYSARVFRWQLLFYPLSTRWNKVLSFLSIGYFLSNILPARIGDVVRAVLLARSEDIPIARSLSTVVVERVGDALTVVLLLVVLIPLIPSIPSEAREAGVGVGLTCLAIIILLIVISLQKERGMRLLRRIAAPFPFLQREGIWHALDSLIEGFAVLHSGRPIVGVVVLSLVVWLFGAVLNWIVMLAMGLQLPFTAAALVIVMTALVVIVPSSPGYIGVYHFVTQLTLNTVFGVDKSVGLTYAVLIHAYVYIWLMVLGTFFIWREGLTYQKLQAVESSAKTN
jgi:uncharacterized protein (TIRG00374 family)